MRRLILRFVIVSLLVAFPTLANTSTAAAETVSAAEIINWMNSMRIANGNSAMIESAALDSSAASAAYQMYANGGCGHPGGKMDRIVASGYGAAGTFFATENIACAVDADLDWIASVWGDYDHQLPATDPQYTYVGAFAFTAPNGTTYYVLHAASGSGGSSSTTTNNNSSGGTNTDTSATSDTSNWVSPIITSTPNKDGSIYHTILYGQALSSISQYYDVSVDQIKTLNALTSNDIYVGDTLLIRLAPTVTITPSRTPTVVQPTRTPTQTMMPTTPKPTRTVTPTPKMSLAESIPNIDRQWLGLGLLILSAVGFFVVLFFSFLKPMRKK